MKHFEIMLRLRELMVVPIVRISSETAALGIVDAVVKGGINCVEITMTVPNALKAIEKVADEYGDKVLLGAGTVLDPETARSCMLAGAQFFVTPSLNLRTIEMATALQPSHISGRFDTDRNLDRLGGWRGWGEGFPCSAFGGAKYIKALKAPFPQIDLIPTGGVNLDTIAEFLNAGSTAVGVGSELVDAKLVEAGNFEIVT